MRQVRVGPGWLQGGWRAVTRPKVHREATGNVAEPEGEAVVREHLGFGWAGLRDSDGQSPHRVPRPGSPFRDEITLAILQLQENNRLEILKRKWWEGGRCPKEEDHRAKGQPPPHAVPFPKAL